MDKCGFCGGTLKLFDADRYGWRFACDGCRRETTLSDAAIVLYTERLMTLLAEPFVEYDE